MRSACRVTLKQNKCGFNLAIRLVLNAASDTFSALGAGTQHEGNSKCVKILIAYFSNTKCGAQENQCQAGADLFKIIIVNPYSGDYNAVLDEAHRGHDKQVHFELSNHIRVRYRYTWTFQLTTLVSIPNASFLKEYNHVKSYFCYVLTAEAVFGKN